MHLEPPASSHGVLEVPPSASLISKQSLEGSCETVLAVFEVQEQQRRQRQRRQGDQIINGGRCGMELAPKDGWDLDRADLVAISRVAQ